jgi:hypothetical protein
MVRAPKASVATLRGMNDGYQLENVR